MRIVTDTFQDPNVLSQDRIVAMLTRRSDSPVRVVAGKRSSSKAKRVRTAYSGAYDLSRYGAR